MKTDMKWVKITLENHCYEVEEIKPRSEPKILFVCEPKWNLHDIRCELLAQVPEEIKNEIIRVWEEIKNEQDTLEVVNKLLAVVLEYDDNPHVRVEFDNYETRIEINPD